MGKALLETLVKYSPVLLGYVFAGLAAYVLPKLRVYLESHAQKNSTFAALAAAEHIAEVVASKVWVDLKPSLSTYSSDGKITPDEWAKMRTLVLADLKEALGTEGKDALQKALGIGEGYLEKYLTGLAAKSSPK